MHLGSSWAINRQFRRYGRPFMRVVPTLGISCLATLAFYDEARDRGVCANSGSLPKIVIARESLVRHKNLSRFDEDYQILGKLGQGGFATVYKVKHRATGFVRTAKIVDFHSASEENVFTNEVEVMTQLDSPYIARILEYYTMPAESADMAVSRKGVILYHFIDGVDLLDCINMNISSHTEFTDSEIRSVVRQILKSLKYLHHHNYVHGDIKPENFVVSSDKTSRLLLKLIDFGLTSRDHISPREVQKAGTSFYMAPEAFGRTAEHYSAKSDCWSVGVIFATIVSRGTALMTRSTSICRQGSTNPIDAEFVSSELLRLRNQGVIPEYIGLMERLLLYDPKARLSASEALNDPVMAGSYKFDPSFVPNLEQAIERIRLHARTPIFARVIRLVAAHQMNDSDVPEMRMVFRCLDADADGLIGGDDIFDLSGEANPQLAEALDLCNISGSRPTLGFEGFIAATTPGVPRRHLEFIFREIDTHRTGIINPEALSSYLSQSEVDVAVSRKLLDSCNGFVDDADLTDGLSFESFERCINAM